MTQLVSVTPQLIDAMNQAQKFDAAMSERRVNDFNRYNDTVEVLNRLTSAVLTASASTPLLAAEVVGPRFDVAGEGLAARIPHVIEYLRGTATQLIQNPNNLSRYERTETDRALAQVRALCAHLTSAIEDQVVCDVRTARDASVAHLVNVAEIVSAAVRRTKKVTGDQPAGEEG